MTIEVLTIKCPVLNSWDIGSPKEVLLEIKKEHYHKTVLKRLICPEYDHEKGICECRKDDSVCIYSQGFRELR